MKKMRAVIVLQPGAPDVLHFTEVQRPQVKPGWSLIKVKGFGINHSEIFTRRGDSPSVAFPRILGIECVGEIYETTEPQRLPVGQRIISLMGEMGRDFDGSYAEYALLPNAQIYPVETNRSWKELATMSETYYTAFGSMENLKIEPSDKVLVRAATSGVGVAFAKLVRARFPKIRLVGSTRNPTKAQAILQVGYSDVIQDLDGRLQTEEKFDKVLELVGPRTIKDTIRCSAEGAIICLTGLLGDQWYLEEFDPIMDLPANGYLTSFYSGNVDQEHIEELIHFVDRYDVDLTPGKVFRLEEVQQAHELLESGKNIGKLIVLLDE